MNATIRTCRAATSIAVVAAAFIALVAAPSEASAQSAEAYVGTFMPHGLEGRDYVDRHISRIQSAMLGCYEQALRSNPSASGMMLTRVFLDRAGQVTEVAVMSNQTGDGALATCVEESVSEIRFSATNSDSASITVPVTFRVRADGARVASR